MMDKRIYPAYSLPGSKLNDKKFEISDSMGMIPKKNLGLSDSFMGGRKVILVKTARPGVYLVIEGQHIVSMYITDLRQLTTAQLAQVARSRGLGPDDLESREAMLVKLGWPVDMAGTMPDSDWPHLDQEAGGVEAELTDLMDLTKKELLQLAEEKGVSVSKAANKTTIVAALSNDGDMTDGDKAAMPDISKTAPAMDAEPPDPSGGSADSLMKHSTDELLQLAASFGLDLKKSATKEDIIAAIKQVG